MNSFEKQLMDGYQMRKTRAQKSAFIEFLNGRYPELRTEGGGLMKSRNIVFGDVEKADIIFTAHYDTCVGMLFPNFIMPKVEIMKILYSLLIVLPMVAVMVAVKLIMLKMGFSEDVSNSVMLLVYFIEFVLTFIVGPANRHTANDNTSGVLAVLRIMDTMSDEQRARAAFVLFDNEEMGCVGSGLFYKKYKKLMADKIVFNMDCIGDGENVLLVATKKARERLGGRIADAFPSDGALNAEVVDAKKVRYPSDQKHFPVSIAAAAFNRHPRFGLYLGRIHTRRDVICNMNNVRYICEGAKRLTDSL